MAPAAASVRNRRMVGRAIPRSGQAGDRDASWAGVGDARQQLGIGGGQLGVWGRPAARRHRRPVPGRRGDAGDVLQTLERPGWQRRADDHRRRRQVVTGDDARQGELERRQQRPLRADALDDGLEVRGHAVGRGDRPEHDAECLASAELDDDRLAGSQAGEAIGDRVGIGPAAGRADRVDGDLDRAGFEHARRQSRTLRRGWRARSASRMASMAAAVRSTSPVSLTTTWS